MSIKITVRIPDDLVQFIDEHVTAGAGTSRADLIATLIRRQKALKRALADRRSSVRTTAPPTPT